MLYITHIKEKAFNDRLFVRVICGKMTLEFGLDVSFGNRQYRKE
jgi:hypothetical protein